MSEEAKERGDLGELAETLLDVVPHVTRTIRMELRSHRDASLSATQFRVLGYVHACRRVSLSNIASHMGLSLPSVSKMVDGMVARGLLDRSADGVDRRRVVIELTAKGEEARASAWKATRESMVRRLRDLKQTRRVQLLGGLESLRQIFSDTGEG